MSSCSTIGGNPELCLPDNDGRRGGCAKIWNNRYPKRSIETIDEIAECNANCLPQFRLNDFTDESQSSAIDGEMENLKIFIDQPKTPLANVKISKESNEGWHKVSSVVDSGVCVTVVDPRFLQCQRALKQRARNVGDAFLVAAGHPIPQLGETRSESHGERRREAIRSTDAKLLASGG